MRSLRAISLAAMVIMAIGCSLFEKQPKDSPRPSTPLAKVTAEQLVAYLNERASMLQTVSSDVRLTAHKGVLSYSLHGGLEASQPRNFRMRCEGGIAGGKVDLGSNSNQFWAYVHVPASEPLNVYASHTDFEAGRAKLPGGMPFEPDWVMQALGMHTFPKNLPYAVPKLNSSDRTFTLSWQATTPSGIAIQKEVVFDADKAPEGKPQVKKHLIRDAKNNVVCSAEVKTVQTVSVANPDPRGAPVNIQCPIQIVLRWEKEKVELDLMMSKVQVNQQFTDDHSRRIFSRPEDFGSPALDLAKYEFTLRN